MQSMKSSKWWKSYTAALDSQTGTHMLICRSWNFQKQTHVGVCRFPGSAYCKEWIHYHAMELALPDLWLHCHPSSSVDWPSLPLGHTTYSHDFSCILLTSFDICWRCSSTSSCSFSSCCCDVAVTVSPCVALCLWNLWNTVSFQHRLEPLESDFCYGVG